jgi:hypothetical protein
MDAHQFRAAEFMLNQRLSVEAMAGDCLELYQCGAIVVDFVNQLGRATPMWWDLSSVNGDRRPWWWESVSKHKHGQQILYLFGELSRLANDLPAHLLATAT